MLGRPGPLRRETPLSRRGSHWFESSRAHLIMIHIAGLAELVKARVLNANLESATLERVCYPLGQRTREPVKSGHASSNLAPGAY